MELLYPRADGPARVSKVDERGLFPLRIPRVHRLRSPGAACILRNVADRYLHLCRFGCQSQETDKAWGLAMGLLVRTTLTRWTCRSRQVEPLSLAPFS